METPHLKPRQHYVDLYDKGTVEQCRHWDNSFNDLEDLKARYQKQHPDKEVDEQELLRTMNAYKGMVVYFVSGDRYVQKEKTIKEWMKRDEDLDQLFDTAVAPEDIPCLTCGRLMFVSFKDLDWAGADGSTTRVLFMYDCPLNHMPRRAFYSDGAEWLPQPKLCSKCQTPVTEESVRKDNVVTTTSTCTKCGNIDTRELDLTPTTPEEPAPDPNYDTDRARFCLTDEKGHEYIEGKASMERLSAVFDKHKEREKEKDLYDKVADLKKFKITELEELLAPILEKAGYIKLSFKTPEVGRDVFVPFVVYESRPDREGHKSTFELEKLIRKTLLNTNWRLMSDGTSYRLGMLEGRLRGYEREEDLLGLIRTQKKKEAKNKGE